MVIGNTCTVFTKSQIFFQMLYMYYFIQFSYSRYYFANFTNEETTLLSYPRDHEWNSEVEGLDFKEEMSTDFFARTALELKTEFWCERKQHWTQEWMFERQIRPFYFLYVNYLIIFIKEILAYFIFFLILMFILRAFLVFVFYLKNPFLAISLYFQTQVLTRFRSVGVTMMTSPTQTAMVF